MKKQLIILFMAALFSTPALACKVYSADGRYRGLVDTGRVWDSEGVMQGHGSTGTVYDVNHATVGYVKNGAIYDPENLVIGRIIGNQVYNFNGGRLGTGESCRLSELGIGAILLLM